MSTHKIYAQLHYDNEFKNLYVNQHFAKNV